MSWKKNPFSYVCWFLYAVLTGTALLCLTGYLSETLRLDWYWGIIFGVLYALCAAVVVVLLHRISIEVSAYFGGRRVLEGLSKSILLAILSTVGLYLRLRVIDDFGTISDILAKTIMAELILQVATAFVLFFILNKLSGYFCGLVSFGFVMCAPQFVQRIHVSSLEMLSLLVVLLVFGLIVIGYRKKLYPALYFCYGALAAFVTCLDFVGVLLFGAVLAMIFVQREYGTGAGRRIAAFICSVFGFAGGFCGCLFVESLLLQNAFEKMFWNCVSGYFPGGFRMPLETMSGDAYIEAWVLVGLMVFGIFSFWYDKNSERTAFGTLLICGVVAMNFFGVEGKLLSGNLLLYLLMVIFAGVSVQQCMCGLCVPREILIPEEPVAEEYIEDCEEQAAQEYAEETDDMPKDIAEETPVERRQIQFIENPLPLPKKHEKKVLDFDVSLTDETSDYDVAVADDDDFDK